MERKIETITTILESGFAVLEVWMYGNDPLVFLVNKFTPSVESNVASIDYCGLRHYSVYTLRVGRDAPRKGGRAVETRIYRTEPKGTEFPVSQKRQMDLLDIDSWIVSVTKL